MNSKTLAAAFWSYTGVTVLLSGVAARYYGDVQALDICLALGSAGLAALWYERNAREHDAYRHEYALLVFLFAVITVPVYLIRSRGWRGGGVALLKIAGLAAVTIALVMLAEVLLYGPGALAF